MAQSESDVVKLVTPDKPNVFIDFCRLVQPSGSLSQTPVIMTYFIFRALL